MSRVGGSAQIKAMRQVAGTLKLELAQYRELAAFAQFGSDLDKATQAQLNRGQRLVELLKQNQFSPLPFSKQILIIFAGTGGFLDDLPVNQVRDFEKELYEYVDATQAGLLRTIMEKKILDDGTEGPVDRCDQAGEAAVRGEQGSGSEIVAEYLVPSSRVRTLRAGGFNWELGTGTCN